MLSVIQRFKKRKERIRSKISKVSLRPRLTVFKSGKHIYAQLIDDNNSITLAAASTVESSIKKSKKSNRNLESAIKIGKLIGERAKSAGINQVVFDKGGYKYHGLLKALADAARGHITF